MNLMQECASTLHRLCRQIRHSRWLVRADGLWDRLRPAYDRLIDILGCEGLRQVINGSDTIVVLPRFRSIDIYEPDFWAHLMSRVHPDDVIADVGAYIGLYTVALAKRVGPEGRVIAFEPDPGNFTTLRAHCRLNRVEDRVELIPAACGDRDGLIAFDAGRASESFVAWCQDGNQCMVPCVKLDTVFSNRPVSILKVDVEGYEEAVLRGASVLLSDPNRRPRLLYLEVHPFAWPKFGTTHARLLELLKKAGYSVEVIGGGVFEDIRHWGKVVAFPV